MLAVLLVGDRYLLQLRDDKPEIDHPGVWGLFGGRVEPSETPAAALLREVGEELSASPDGCRFLWRVDEPSSRQRAARRYWFFEADFSRYWGTHRLMEGAGAACFTFDALAVIEMPPIIRDALTRYHLLSRASILSEHDDDRAHAR